MVTAAQPEENYNYDWQIDKNENKGIKQHRLRSAGYGYVRQCSSMAL
jgi:hypothetical protein